MHTAIISGSHRAGSNSARVAGYLEQRIAQLNPASSAWVRDLHAEPLPLWDEGVWANSEKWQAHLPTLHQQLQDSDALVVISPEWHGMVPAGLKNFFLLCGTAELAHKPALIVSVSAGVAGGYPVAELRMSSYKNNRLCYLPEHVIIRDAGKVLHDDSEQNDADQDRRTRARLDYGLGLLEQYAQALAQVRASGAVDHERYAFGM